MAINPHIPLSVQTLDVGQAFNNALLNMQRAQKSQQLQSQQQQNDLKAAVTLAGPIRASLSGGDLGTARSLISRLPMEAQTEALQMLDRGDNQGLINLATQLESLAPKLGITQEQTGLASAKTYIFDNGTVIQALPDESTVVQDPSGRIVEGQERIDVLKRARQEQVAFAGERAAATARGTAGVELETAPQIAADVEAAKLEEQRKKLPNIRAAVSLAESEAKRQGETLTTLKRAEAALPGLRETVGSLKELAKVATSTFGGRVFDIAAKELGFGATKGATARAKFIAIVNNQVLPLLRDTFGSAFTVQEGESLKATMGDPNASEEEKLAQLDAFIDQKLRTIETGRRELQDMQQPSEQSPVQTAPQQPSSVLRFDAQGNLVQ